MEKKTIGKFISALRRANGMTQKELGDKLYVSDKTVSRWECDECTPELSLIPSIAEIFGITTDELLRGERNNPDREAAISEDVASKQRAKSDKQFRLMLHSGKKRFTNLSFISIGLTIVGLISAMICNLGFSKGMLGFCLASVFLVAATICQICFTVSFRLLIDEEEAEHAEEIKKTNTDMVLSSVKIFFGIFLTFAFCLPIALLGGGHYGLTLETWFRFGALFAAASFLLGFCIYKIFILKVLIEKRIVLPDEQTVARIRAEGRLLLRICIVFLSVLAITVLATDIITSYVSESTFIKRERFDDPDEFIDYMQSEYDKWYNEGYGDLPANERPPHEYMKKWAKIDDKEYYYNPTLYESIDILEYKNGELEIVVTTNEADQNGEAMYTVLMVGLLSLHAVNFAVCVVWYLVKVNKKKIA